MNNYDTTYKDSPLGKIPDDWAMKRLEEFAHLAKRFNDLPVEKIIAGEYLSCFL